MNWTCQFRGNLNALSSGLRLSERVVYLHLFTLLICGLAVAQSAPALR